MTNKVGNKNDNNIKNKTLENNRNEAGDEDINYMQNRELSWLKFNERVLSEARDETVPLIERLKYVSIFLSNLDEFFMVRVGSLYDLDFVSSKEVDKRTGMTAIEQIHEIHKRVKPLFKQCEEIYDALKKELANQGINKLSFEDLNEKQKDEVKKYFTNNIQPLISPIVMGPHHPFPHMINKKTYVFVNLKLKSKNSMGIIPLPSTVPDEIFLNGKGINYIDCHDIILAYAHLVFSDYKIIEKVKIRVTRNADINVDENQDYEKEIDFRIKIKKALKKRQRLAPVRLEMSKEISKDMKEYLYSNLELDDEDTYVSNLPGGFKVAFDLGKKLNNEQKEILEFKNYTLKIPEEVNMGKSMLDQIRNRDLILAYPYESMEPFLKFLKESAMDKEVVSIKITIYRLSSKSKLVEYLCEAAERGKDVTVLIEIRARFDEQNNIDWSERLEEAGCNIIYGVSSYKVHSKLCLVTRREHGKIKYYTQVGTGNYNEKTATQYTDLAFMTYNQEIGVDANTFFQNMGIGNLDGNYKHLLVAPNSMKNKIIEMIEEETKKGDEGKIFIKINSLTDIDIIRSLKIASSKGVKIDMVIRGICCILPNVENATENINITSIVGRFLEHTRIYSFGSGDDMKIYISSADFMTRNLKRRIEVACPIYDNKTRRKILDIIRLCQKDNVKARKMLSDGNLVMKEDNGEFCDSQKLMVEWNYEKKKEKQHEIKEEKKTLWEKLKTKLNYRK